MARRTFLGLSAAAAAIDQANLFVDAPGPGLRFQAQMETRLAAYGFL